MAFIFNKPKKYGVSQDMHNSHMVQKEDKKIPKAPEFIDRIIADKKPSSPVWEPLHRAADAEVEDLSNLVVIASNQTKRNVNNSLMRQGILDRNQNNVYTSIPFDIYDEKIQDIEGFIKIAFDKAGQGMIIHLPPKMRGVKFDSTTDRAKQIIATRGGNLIREMSNSSREAIRIEIGRAMQEGLGADVTAKNLKSLIGLTSRQARAVTNFRTRMLVAGATMGRSQMASSEYANRLLRSRAETIARTELMTAANEGHLEMVNQSIDQGFIVASEVQREWIVTPDDRICQYCAPMDGQLVGMDEDFQSAIGSVRTCPLHPNCRCVTAIKYKK